MGYDYNAKAVHRYSLDGEYIDSFASLSEAKRALGMSGVGTISKVCRVKRFQAGGFRWSYDKVDKLEDYYPEIDERYCPIYLDLTTSSYKEYIDKIIQTRGRTLNKSDKERHHILPRCLGGSAEEENLIDLEYEEHFIAHQLLAKENPENLQLVHAFRLMSNIRRAGKKTVILTPEGYRAERLKNKYSLQKTNYGKERKEETKWKISKANKGKKRTQEQIDAMASRLKEYYKTHEGTMKGKRHSEEARAKMREAHKHRDPSTYKGGAKTPEKKAEAVRKFKETYWAKPEEERRAQAIKAVASRKASVKYWQGKTIPQETRDKISATLREKSIAPPHSIAVYCEETQTTYRSLTEAERQLGISRKTIRNYLDGKNVNIPYHLKELNKQEG